MNKKEISRGQALMLAFDVNDLDELIEAIESDVAEGKTLIAIGKIRKAMSLYAMGMQPSSPPQKSDEPCTIDSTDMEGNCFKCNAKGMEILRHDHYKDGGTMVLYTNKGDYAYDYRIRTTTYGELYEGYPLRDGSNIVRDESIKDKVRIALANYIANFVEEDSAYSLKVLKSIYNKTY
jgi:hypothetical protein